MTDKAQSRRLRRLPKEARWREDDTCSICIHGLGRCCSKDQSSAGGAGWRRLNREIGN